MEYYSKVLILKESEKGFSLSRSPVSAILRLESEGGVCTLSLSVINLVSANGGEYFLFFSDGKKNVYRFPLGKKPTSFTEPLKKLPNIDKGFSAGLFFLQSVPVLVAFGQSENTAADSTELKKSVASFILREKADEEKKTAFPFVPQNPAANPNGVPSPPVPPVTVFPIFPEPKEDEDLSEEKQSYDDEVVATENYFERDRDFEKKLKIIERIDDELLRNQNALHGNGKQEKKNENEYDFSGAENERYGEESQRYSKGNPFFDKVKDKLENLFARFPTEENLSKTVPESRWVKIGYAENKYYVVGVVKSDGKEKYVCYGVPAEYSPNPPEQLKGYCSFVPSSVFKLKGDGYWMMFQDAVTGTCVKM